MIESTMHEMFSNQKSSNTYKMNPSGPIFCLVNSVAKDSPAEKCGLIAGDKLISFSSITQPSPTEMTLKNFASFIGKSENVNMKLVVLRGTEELQLSLKPSKWSGNGLLGYYYFIPLSF
jgi:S1-C subfamily serine protease